jgi:tRNA nucleotidyltransferase (CCA-adding enzyme)
MQIITTHNNADFDAVASMLAAHKLYPEAIPLLPPRQGRNVRQFLTLYRNGLPFMPWNDFRPHQSAERLILVDTQRALQIKRVKARTPTLIIDHHPREVKDTEYLTFTGDEIGSATTLLVEQIRQKPEISLNSLEATLLLLGIYSDTGALTYGRTDARDAHAAAWLIEQNAVLDTVRRFLAPPLADDQRALFDRLVETADTRIVQGYTVTIGAATLDHYVENINSVAYRLRELLDPVALFLLVAMPDRHGRVAVQIVCRSRNDAIDVGAVARHFGGGGHNRAAAANVSGRTPEQIAQAVWDYLDQNTRPIVRVADLMSYGVQTISADTVLDDVIERLRRIGHEGYPVIDAEQHVVGLLTMRDADRALTHGLRDSLVRDVMSGGEITLTPEDSVSALERLIVDSGWGQIPIVDDDDHLIGIVTRTDLIKHWVTVHPAAEPAPDDKVDVSQVEQVLGAVTAGVIDLVAAFGQKHGHKLYMVGGVVRDILLERANYDLDFVIEDDAIAFAEALCAAYGGEVNSYRPFGTATWSPGESVAEQFGVARSALPGHIDFATARNEFYEHPTALPSVYSGSIKLDLHRRDFTINTLAIQLSPEPAAYRLLDFYGGLRDLRRGVIRVLHSLSFVDDPTRVLRAVRFEHRLDFSIEDRTAELIDTARPMLRSITGERLRNEMKLLLNEQEPERVLLKLAERDILNGIYADFSFLPATADAFRAARTTRDRWPLQPEKLRHLYWVLTAAYMPPAVARGLGQRLRFSQSFIACFADAATLRAEPGALADPDAPPSAITLQLDDVCDLALLALWVIGDDRQRDRLTRYIQTWQTTRPLADGHTLKAMGLQPGPRFGLILARLRAGWLDGEIENEDDERRMLDALIEETDHDRTG